MLPMLASAVLMGLAAAIAGCAVHSPPAEPTLQLHVSASPTLNASERDIHSQAAATRLHLYQLSDRQAFDNASYEQLLDPRQAELAADVLSLGQYVIHPASTGQWTLHLDPRTRYIAAVAFLRAPQGHQWRRVLCADELEDNALRLHLTGDRLMLEPRP